MTTFYFLSFETVPTWRAKFSYLYPPGTGWPGYIPRTWVHFSSSPTSHRATMEVFDPASAIYCGVFPPCSNCWSHTKPRKARNSRRTNVCCSLLGNEAIMGSLFLAPRPLLCNEWCTRFNTSSRVRWFLCVVGAWVPNEDSFQFSRSSRSSSARSSSQLVPDKKWISDATRNTQARQRIEIRSTEEYKESACEELTHCDYSEIESVIVNCKFRMMIYPINRNNESRTHKLFDALPGESFVVWGHIILNFNMHCHATETLSLKLICS
jgi:hypothetical protein